MNLQPRIVAIESLQGELESWLKGYGRRIGMLTSLTGAELVIVVLDPLASSAQLWQAPVKDNSYASLTVHFPQLHWSERVLWNVFGIVPEGHPRLKPPIVHEHYPADFYALRTVPIENSDFKVVHEPQNFLEVGGEGVWELPVGPVHAGIIEPGHFRFSCLGENILNLELKFGYVHRGVSKRMTEVPWRKARFVAEAAASDTTAGYALAHAIALESVCGVEVSAAAQVMRTVALEIERVAMHIADIGGMMTDIGLISMAAMMAKLRGVALGMAQTISGSRFLRSYILPGGVGSLPSHQVAQDLRQAAVKLQAELRPLMAMLKDNQSAIERMDGVGRIRRSLAVEFGLVGVAARACAVDYDVRRYYSHGVYPNVAPAIALERMGDIWARTNVRISELQESLRIIGSLLEHLPEGPAQIEMPEQLLPNQVGLAIVESFRGELIHLCVTGHDGTIVRYAFKDPSFNNWTALPIAVRDNLIADFPLCNKSLALSYSGNDL